MSTTHTTITGYKDLIVWQKSMDLVDAIYSLTRSFPKEELFCLVSQMRRSAISIPSNIAEGKNRGTKKDYRHFLLMAFGSGAELETQILVSKRQSLGKAEDYPLIDGLITEVMKMLNALISKLDSTTSS